MHGFPATAFALNLVWAAIAVIVVQALAVAVAVRRDRHDGVDVAWGLGFCAIAVVTLAASSGNGVLWRRLLVTALVLAWGLRLAVHIARRAHGRPEDRRYIDLLGGARGNRTLYALRRIYLPQAVVMWFVSLPVQAAQYGDGGPWWPVVTGAAVWAVGFGFEAIGDAQLAAFTRATANRGAVLDRGLWRYTRHPNYFGDACVWWGLYLTACHSWVGVLTVLSPVLMTANLVKGTGKALLERDIGDRRPGYREYVARTSGFVPLPPRRRP